MGKSDSDRQEKKQPPMPAKPPKNYMKNDEQPYNWDNDPPREACRKTSKNPPQWNVSNEDFNAILNAPDDLYELCES